MTFSCCSHSLSVAGNCGHLLLSSSHWQEKCSGCGGWTTVDKGSRHHRCPQCERVRRHPPGLSSPSPLSFLSSTPSLPPPPLFDRPPGCLDQLTLVQRSAIVTLYLYGRDRSEIARLIPCHVNTVGHWIRAWQQRRDLSDAERSGRPRITTAETDESIVDFAEEKKFTTPHDIRMQMELDLSDRTIRRRLDEGGLHGRVARSEPHYRPDDIKRRLSFARGFSWMTEAHWELIIFSDETHFDRFGHGRPWVQRPEGEAFDPQYMTQRTENFESVGLWACFCARGIGQAEIYVGEYKSKQYCSMLQANLLDTANHFYVQDGHRDPWQLLQDNAPQHSSYFTSVWLHNHGVSVLEFPPYSPDLNPIENLFHVLKQRVFAHFPHTAAEVEAAITAEWEHLPPSLLLTLAHSMPARLKAVIENEGHMTKY